MKPTRLIQALSTTFALTLATLGSANAASVLDGASQVWANALTSTPGFVSEIVAFDATSKTLWVAGVKGVNVLDAKTGASLSFIDTSAWGSINSVAVHNGIAAFAIEASDRKLPGVVQLYDTTSRSLLAGTNTIAVGSLPDMLTFTPDGSRLLVANEGTPNWVDGGVNDYGTRIGTSVPRVYGTSANDPIGSVSIIDVASRTVTATATLAGVTQTGSHIRTGTGMDFEPEYIAVNKAGTEAYVSLQEANAMGVLNLQSGQFTKVVGLGAKDFSQAGNAIDTLNNGTVSFANVAAKGLYMPDGMATFQAGAKTYVVMANEGDFREDDADRSAASSGSLGGTGNLANLRVSNTDSSAGNLFAAGARSFSIRDADGNLVYDSGNILDVQAHLAGIYDDGRSRDKGVEPEGVELMEIGGKTFAFVGLERTTSGAVAVFDIDVNDPSKTSFVRMLTVGQLRPEGLEGFTMDGMHYLAIASEGADGVNPGTTLFALAPVPEPSTYALMLAGLAGVGLMARRRRG
jgi:DNA-binding beta-propeller fold protein YncE